jgi:hypothetical protein
MLMGGACAKAYGWLPKGFWWVSSRTSFVQAFGVPRRQ